MFEGVDPGDPRPEKPPGPRRRPRLAAAALLGAALSALWCYWQVAKFLISNWR